MKENEDNPRKTQSLQKKCWCGRVYYGERCKEGHEQSPVTDADLARVAELDAKATKGPWSIGTNEELSLLTDVVARDGEDWIADCGQLNGLGVPICEANAQLIAEYRTLCPRIARELIAARAQIEKMQDDDGGLVDQFIHRFMNEITALGMDISSCDGEDDPAVVIARWVAGRIKDADAQIAADAEKLKVAREALQYVKAKAVFPLGAIPDRPWSKIDAALTQLDAKP